MPRKFAIFTALLFILSFIPAAYSQSATSGAISGTVSDANGALVPNVTIKVTNGATGQERTVTTSKSGEFRVPELEPGVYTAVFTADGFGVLQQDLITVTVGSVTSLSPKLSVGANTEKVDVSAEGNLDIHLAGSEISTTIDQNTIDNLPINGRRWSDFALLTPGVVSNSDGFGLLSFRGISYLLNNSTVDGADDNQAYFSEARGRTRSSYTVTQGAVQEFQVNTSNYSAEYGRAAGGVINTVTKSGSNQLHGELFFYDRDNGLGGATNPYTQIYNFDQNTGLHIQTVKPKDWRKQWGFGMGGALLKDKLFWFYAYDQSRRNFPGIARTTDPNDMFTLATPLSGKESCSNPGGNNFGAPQANYVSPDGTSTNGTFAITANLSTPATGGSVAYPLGQSYQGNFAACALAVAIAGTTSPSAVNYQQGMAYYNQGLGVLATFFGPVPRTGDQVINFPKVDYQVNERNRVTAQYNRLRWDSPNGVQTQTSNFYGRGSYGSDYVKADVGIMRLSSVVTNTIVNSFLVQYGRDMETEFPSKTLPNEKPLVNALSPGECSAPHNGPCLAAAPDLSIGFGYDAAGFDGGTVNFVNRFALPDERRLQLKDDLTWSHGLHVFKFGLDYNKVSDYINNLYNGYGTYNFDWAYSFIGDYLHATTGLGGGNYAGSAGTVFNASSTDYNYGLYSSFSQGYTVPQDYNRTANTGTPDNVGSKSQLTTREYAGYATDDWRISPKLTLTLGVRYEYEYIPANPTPNPDLVGSSATRGGGLFAATRFHPDTTARPDDRNNVQPRFGFALNVFGNNKTMLRGGYGMYFGRIINANIEQSYQNSGGPGSQVNISGLFSDATTSTKSVCEIHFPQVVTSYTQAYACALATNNASSHPSISYLDSHLQNPQVHEADLALEQDLGHGVTLGITYMSSFGRELNSATDANVNLANSTTVNYIVNNTPPGPGIKDPVLPHGGKPAPLLSGTTSVKVYGTSIDPTTGAVNKLTSAQARYDSDYYRVLRIASNVNSNYNALAFQINKRYRNGFSLLSNFTWAHALDFNPYIGTGIPGPSTLDPGDVRKDYGNSSLDVRRRFVMAITYQPQTHFRGWKDAVAGGWRIAPILQVQSGNPYSPFVSGYPGESVSGVRSANGAGGTSGRIDAIRRNQYTRPKTAKADVRVGKNFYMDFNHYGIDRLRLEFFAEVFNVANHQNITGIQNTAYNLTSVAVTPSAAFPTGFQDTMTLQPNFGTYNNSNSNYTYTPRQLQLAVRLHF